MSGHPLVDTLRSALSARQEDLVCAYLFGRQARGDWAPGSDVDIALLFVEDPPKTLAGLHLDLADDLSGALAPPVDLVVLNRASPELIHRVLRDGVLLMDLDPSARIRFEVCARNEYFDLLPHLRRYRRARGDQAA